MAACVRNTFTSANLLDDDNFVRKVNAGANSAIAQYFFNADAYWHFVDTCATKGIDIYIVPGIMPITNYSQLAPLF